MASEGGDQHNAEAFLPRLEVPAVRVVTVLPGPPREFMIPRTKYFP
jgi:hypothetical protein